MILQDWFINSNFSIDERNAIKSGYYMYSIKETERAHQCVIETDYGNIKRWVPKAAIGKLCDNRTTIDLEIGDVVKHKQFGEGVITEVRDDTVFVDFKEGIKHMINDVRYLVKVGVKDARAY